MAAVASCSTAAPLALRGTPQEIVRAAADRTVSFGTAHVDISVGAELAGTGIIDLTDHDASLTFSRTGPQAHLDDRFDVIVDGATEWLRASGNGGGVPGTTPAQPWITGSPQAVTAAAHTRVDPLDTLLVRPGLGTDLAFLRGAVHVTAYGGEEVRGASTYRYTFDVDLPTAVANSPAADRPALEAAEQAIGPVQWPADVWVDTRGRVRELQMAENPFTHTTTTKPNLLITEDGNYLALTNIQLYDFGTPAAVSPPPVTQAVEASSS